ncbi:MAG: TonB-dependent receptor, partial [Sphingobium sp.]
TSLNVDIPGPSAPFSGLIPQNRTQGNLNLRPEKADTFTLGAVFQPRAIPGLRASVDYYNIDLRDAIDSLSAATIGTLCTNGDLTFCSFITTNAAGVPTGLFTGFRNYGSFKTQGLDMAVSYRMSLGGGTSLTTRISGTYALHSYVNAGTPGAPTIDRAGENGQGNLGALPRFRGNLTETLETGPFTLSAQVLFISAGKNDNLYTTQRDANGLWGPLSITDNSVPAAAYINLFSSVKVTDRFEFGLNIDNLLDKDPPFVPYQTQGQYTSGAYYDKIGRTFEVTARAKF